MDRFLAEGAGEEELGVDAQVVEMIQERLGMECPRIQPTMDRDHPMHLISHRERRGDDDSALIEVVVALHQAHQLVSSELVGDADADGDADAGADADADAGADADLHADSASCSD